MLRPGVAGTVAVFGDWARVGDLRICGSWLGRPLRGLP